MKIEILGPGCPKCHEAEKNVRLALDKLGVEAEVQHLTDIKEIVKRGVALTPGVAVDGNVLISGHVPTVDELVAHLGGTAS